MTTSPQPPFCVPLERNPLFVRRAADLDRLAGLLAAEGATAVLCGVGGLGKTQLAVEFAYQEWAAGHYPGGVFWVVMEQPEGIAAQVAALAGPDGLALPGFDPQAQAANLAAVRRAWEGPAARLLIFDNLEDPALLPAWRPRVGGSRVLVTSRNTAWPARLGAQVFPLAVLPRTLSRVLLLEPRARSTGRTVADLLPDEAAIAAADALCEWLGDLPLALALAGAYLETTPSVSLARYLAALQATPVEHASLNLPPAQDVLIGHEASLAATFLRSYDRLDEQDPTDALVRFQAACWGLAA